ncbi:hypothetical protein [Commensalibacter papalotli (ex Servin-Garciduenas et al. 2014)]|uniref:CHAD domain-containing protein n=1 Tax=Commensalibacter papalotli (ex Servin-Garciduenas et al. 2014) TaxID=1208583 RepID=W7E8J4_9PROT|nr:hypothetical protein [Commensalibacter papalotli (ex Servin-Garciduenas et al. 2014)]EUK19461.1 hypothetical protein COMX_06905 [Commensalibacter papalotli (ex Servin-Garciduenas et al. 2014)]
MIFKKNVSIHAKQIVDFERFHFSEEQCQQLYDMICVDDKVDLQSNLPSHINFDYTQKQLIEGFMISRQLWLEGILDKRFPEIVKQLCSSYHISEEDKVIYKMVRAKFKHLCYACRGFDERHKPPFLLGRTTALLGIIQDGFKHKKANIVIPNALLLNALWNKKGQSLLKKEVYRFFPCDVESFTSAVNKRVTFIQNETQQNSTVSAHQFHTLRKQMSMLSAVYGTFDVLFPSSYHHQTFQYLATINGLMGDYHDILIERKINKTQNYFFDHFIIPEEISSRLANFIKHFTTK